MTAQDFAQQALQELEADRHSGASQLARRCLGWVVGYVRVLGAVPTSTVDQLRSQVTGFAKQLQSARPSMAPIHNLLQQLIDLLNNLPPTLGDAISYIEEQAEYIVEQSEQAVLRVAAQARGLIKPQDVIFTHSISSTILEIFRRVADLPVKAIVTESRPGNEGRLLVEQLSSLAITTTYITDAQMGLFVGQSDIVLVGADSVLKDGSVINKAGTYLLALAARDTGVPFYVCCESHKWSEKTPVNIELEEKDSEELGLTPLPSITVHNVYFDVTPSRLISGYISENDIKKSFT